MEYSKEDLMEAKKQIWGVGENMGTEESKKIWEENAQFWDNAMGDESNEFHREVVRPKVTELLSPNPADYILDIACGNGNYSSYLAQRGASVVAFDYSKNHAGFAASHHGGVQQCRDCGGVVFRLWAVADFGSRSAFWSAGAKARRRIRAPFLCLGAEIRPDARSARAGGSDYRCVARIVSALSPVRGEPECGIGKINDMYWWQ